MSKYVCKKCNSIFFEPEIRDITELTEVEQKTLEIIQQRNEKGRQTYGKGLDHNDDYNWIDMAIEECADMLKYLVAQKLKMENQK